MEESDVMESEDLAALLGSSLNLDKVIGNAPDKRYELANLDANNLEEHIVQEAEDIAEKAKWAVTDVLLQVQTTPNDAELIEAAAKLLAAATQAQAAHLKVYSQKEKFKQQVYLQKMKLTADMKMNDDNNQTKVLLSRDELMSKYLDNKEKNTNNVLDT